MSPYHSGPSFRTIPKCTPWSSHWRCQSQARAEGLQAPSQPEVVHLRWSGSFLLQASQPPFQAPRFSLASGSVSSCHWEALESQLEEGDDLVLGFVSINSAAVFTWRRLVSLGAVNSHLQLSPEPTSRCPQRPWYWQVPSLQRSGPLLQACQS